MADLYNYTFLNANNYLTYFKHYLLNPNLTRAELTKYLHILNKNMKWKDFIIRDYMTDKFGNKRKVELYSKEMLNRILGINRIGIEEIKPQNNPLLIKLKNIISPSISYNNYDNYDEYDGMPEADMDKISQHYIEQDNINESKKLFITELQFRSLLLGGYLL